MYADTRSDVSDYSDNESLDSDSNVPTTSSHKQLWSSTGPLTPQFPHPLFLTFIKTIFYNTYENNILKINSVRLAQTLLDRNMTACGTMRANTDIPRDLEGEGKRLKKREVSILEEWW